MYNAREHISHPALSKVLPLLALLLSFLLSACSIPALLSQPTSSGTNQPPATPAPPLPTLPSTPQPLRSTFERGIAYPRWNQDSYGLSDTAWRQGIHTIKAQTGATWLEIPILFTQAAPSSTTVETGTSTPNLDAFASGIRAAHALGYHVFFAPLMGVNVPGGWSGLIQFGTFQQEQAWFLSYWNTLKPYVTVAQDNNVEQMAIGTELQWLDQHAPASLWNELIARVRSVFKGSLVYDLNWPSLYQSPPAWLKNPDLAMIGVSEYIPLVDSPIRIAPKVMPALWQSKIGKLLDALSTQVGKQVLITEIGYRDTSDALYNPWNAQSLAPSDGEEQAAAYEATLINASADPHIAGVFFWGWDDVGRLAIKNQRAVQVMHTWYTQISMYRSPR